MSHRAANGMLDRGHRRMAQFKSCPKCNSRPKYNLLVKECALTQSVVFCPNGCYLKVVACHYVPNRGKNGRRLLNKIKRWWNKYLPAMHTRIVMEAAQ